MTLTETVGLTGTLQRAGEGGSLAPVQQKPKITPELQADKNREGTAHPPRDAFLSGAGFWTGAGRISRFW